jgi:hypothetical protein
LHDHLLFDGFILFMACFHHGGAFAGQGMDFSQLTIKPFSRKNFVGLQAFNISSYVR